MKFFIPTMGEQYFKLAEKLKTKFEVTFSQDDAFDAIITMAELDTTPIAEIAQQKNVPFPDVSFCSKDGLKAKCVEAGVAYPESVVLSSSALENCVYPHFIIKPKNSSGSKHDNPAVYKIFSNEDRLVALGYLADTPNLSDFILQRAYINPTTRETKLLFVDGAINGDGRVFFNPIADKVMLDPSEVSSHITHKTGIRLVDFSDKYDFKRNVTTLLSEHGIRNTLFKTQAIVDEEAGTCLINDWSWGVMPYTHVNILDAEYLCSQLEFAYDLADEVEKPIDKIICMKHIAMPACLKSLNTAAFNSIVNQYESLLNVNRVEPLRHAVTAVSENWFCLYGVTCTSAEEGEARLNEFENSIKGIQL